MKLSQINYHYTVLEAVLHCILSVNIISMSFLLLQAYIICYQDMVESLILDGKLSLSSNIFNISVSTQYLPTLKHSRTFFEHLQNHTSCSFAVKISVKEHDLLPILPQHIGYSLFSFLQVCCC